MQCLTNFQEYMVDIGLIADAAQRDRASKDATERARANALTRSALVLLCGYFEGFVRDLLAEYIDLINDAKVKSCAIPELLLHSALLDLLSKVDKSTAAVNIKTTLLSNSHIQINAKKHSKTGGNPTVDTVEALFAAIGVPDVIDALSIADYGVQTTFTTDSQLTPQFRGSLESILKDGSASNPESMGEAIIALIEEKWNSKKKRRKVGYVGAIEELLRSRNLIAHGEGREPIAVEELREFSAVIFKLCDGLHSIMTVRLGKVGIRIS